MAPNEKVMEAMPLSTYWAHTAKAHTAIRGTAISTSTL